MIHAMLLITIALFSPTSRPFDPCSKVFDRYEKLLKEAATDTLDDRKKKLTYLKKMEQTIKNCFDKERGQDLIQDREKLEGIHRLQRTRKILQKMPTQEQMVIAIRRLHRRVINLEQGSQSGFSTSSFGSSRWVPTPAGAALASLAIPGLGQVLQKRSGAAWGFFLGVVGCSILGSSFLVVSGLNAAQGKKASTDAFMGVGIAAFAGGGILHLINIINAATWKSQ